VFHVGIHYSTTSAILPVSTVACKVRCTGMSCVIVKENVAQISSIVRPVDCVSQKVTCVMVTMTVEITRMKQTVDTVNDTTLSAIN